MDCARAADIIEAYRLGDQDMRTSGLLQKAVDHVTNCGCDSCNDSKDRLGDPRPNISIAQG